MFVLYQKIMMEKYNIKITKKMSLLIQSQKNIGGEKTIKDGTYPTSSPWVGRRQLLM